MNSLLILIYIAAAGVSAVLRIQARREKGEIMLECARKGIPLPESGPRIRILESLLNMAAGIVLLVPPVIWFNILLRGPVTGENSGAGMIDFNIFLLAGGLTLVVLGGTALLANLKRGRRISNQAPCSEV
jgi:hypothetical protein